MSTAEVPATFLAWNSSPSTSKGSPLVQVEIWVYTESSFPNRNVHLSVITIVDDKVV
jgi:hypothetical protein